MPNIEYTKNNGSIFFKRMNFMACKLSVKDFKLDSIIYLISLS